MRKVWGWLLFLLACYTAWVTALAFASAGATNVNWFGIATWLAVLGLSVYGWLKMAIMSHKKEGK